MLCHKIHLDPYSNFPEIKLDPILTFETLLKTIELNKPIATQNKPNENNKKHEYKQVSFVVLCVYLFAV
jgi:hypothetical protein